MQDIINFNMLEYALRHWWETEFSYDNINFSILNLNKNDQSSWWLICNQYNLDEEICNFEDFDTLIEKIKNFKIKGKTIQNIFNEWHIKDGNLFGFDLSYFDSETLKSLK